MRIVPRYLLHTQTWSNKEKQGFQVGDNIIQVEKTSHKLQTGFTVRLDGTKHAVIIHKIDHSGKEIAINKLDGGEKTFGPLTTVPIEFGGKILLFYFRYQNKDTMKLYVSEVDKNSLQLVNTQLLYSYQQDNVGILKIESAIKDLLLHVSEDESKLCVVFPGYKGEIFSCVFDKDIQVLRKKVSNIRGVDDLIISEIYVDNNANDIIIFSKETVIFIPSKAMTSLPNERISSTRQINTITKKIMVQTFNSNERLIDVDALAGGVELRNAHLQGSRDKTKVYMFGDYAGEVANAGIWLSEIPSGQFSLTKPRTFAYPEEFKKEVYEIGFGERRRGSYGILDAVELQLAEFENGDLAICGSPLLMRDATTRDITPDNKNGDLRGYITFFSGPVMLAFLKEKKEGVFGMIPRYQWYCGGSKSVFMPYQDKLVVIYNDVAKNINNTKEVRMKGINMARELSLAAAIVNKDGKVESEKMLAEGIRRLSFYSTSNCEFLSDRKLLIPASSGDKNSDEMNVVVITVE